MTVCISIIIPLFNQEKYIEETLDSVLAQSFTEFEVIIVNDGSTDSSVGIVEKYIKQDSRFNLITQTNQGLSRARNNGIQKSKYDLIFPLDSDDKMHPNLLEKLYSTISSTNYRLVSCEVELFGYKNQLLIQPKFTKLQMYGIHEKCIPSALFYKNDFLKFGGYKECFSSLGGEDMDFYLNYIDKNLPIFRIPEVLFFYRAKSIDESYWKRFEKKVFKQRMRKKTFLLRKHHPQMVFYEILYNIPHLISTFLYQDKINKKRERVIRIFRIPVYRKKIV